MRSISSIVLILSLAIESSQGVIFDCEFGFQNIVSLGSVYTCKPNVIKSESGRLLDDMLGSHLEGKTYLDVEFLSIGQQDLTYIPKGIEKFFPNLIGIDYYNSNLGTISSDDLRPFPQLLKFTVYHGNLVSLDGNLLQHNLNLRYVSFYGNKIEHIGHNLLSELDQLQWVYFNYNVCVNQTAIGLESIRLLSEELPILCPPTEIMECSDQLRICSNENLDLLLENEKTNERNTELEIENKANNDQLLFNKKEIEKANEKIIELEMLIRELLAGTCS